MQPINVLVSGGAGYIGSHTSHQLVEAGHNVTVVDNLYSGYSWAVPESADFHQIDVGNIDAISDLLKHNNIEAVLHFAGYIVVPESVANPIKYYDNNVVASCRLIEACHKHGISSFIFSSSAAVYGNATTSPVPETQTPNPITPYGRTKLTIEWMLQDLSNSAPHNSPMRHVSLRYFNVAGARVSGGLGQATPNATHLIKVACEAADGSRDGVSIFGTDYDTPDGTCIRDYIHVDDLAAAHVDALNYLSSGGASCTLNCGYGRGFSVREVLNMVHRVSGKSFPVTETSRRAGDPAQLVADNTRIREVLHWQPQCDDLELICRTALDWEASYSKG